MDKNTSLIKLLSPLLLALAVSLPLPDAALGVEKSLSFRGELPSTKKTPLKWGRDIFRPLVRASDASEEEAVAELDLKAIFFTIERPSVIINDSILYRGSTIKGQKVIVIGKGHVILQGKRGKIRLELDNK